MNHDHGDICVDEKIIPRRINVETGRRYRKEMPSSEVMMHMNVVDQQFDIELFGHMVQLYREDGTEFSSKVTAGEAGLYWDEDLKCYFFCDE